MAKAFSKKFYNTRLWEGTRDTIRKRDRYLCQDCLKKGMITPGEEVHHIIPLTPDNINDMSITINPKNLVLLCKECHKARHKALEGKESRYTVDELGHVRVR